MIANSKRMPRKQHLAAEPEVERWEFYKDRFDEWQWRKFQGKKVITVSAGGFYSRQACVNNARTRGYLGS